MKRVMAHIRRLWPKYPFWPLVPFLLHAIVSAVRSDLRLEHGASLLLVAVLAYSTPRTKTLLLAVYPVGLVGLLYDAMRPLQNVGLSPERIHVCDIRGLEARLFGFESGGATLTLHDWFLTHHLPALDLYCALPYATHVLVALAFAAFLGFRDRLAMTRFTWGFLLMNLAGFATYHLVPTAPPWYFHTHGCAVDLATRASEGPALARVDALLGISYFHTMYSKASSVFGALPSLHCAYPFLVVIEGFRVFGPKMRALSIVYWASMVFASVYLDHHWLIDGILGSLYAVVAALILRRFVPRKATILEQPLAFAGAAE